MALLPADQRLRCAEVCRAWRRLVAEPELWRSLDLGFSSDVARPVSERLLRACLARARGGLQALDLSACGFDAMTVCAALRENPHVTTLSVYDELDAEALVTHNSAAALLSMLNAAPALRELHADARCRARDAAPLLQNAAPWGPLRLRALRLETFPPHALEPLRPLLQDRAVHPSLRELIFSDCGDITQEALSLIADFAVARALPALRFCDCNIEANCLPALGRAVADGELRELTLNFSGRFWGHCAGMRRLAAALRANHTLTSFTCSVGVSLLVHEAVLQSVYSLLGAFRDHASLQKLTASFRAMRVLQRMHTGYDARSMGAALGAVIVADAPALTCLDVSCCHLGDEGLIPLLSALRSNTHLRELVVAENDMSSGFARTQLVEAIHANAGLRQLRTDQSHLTGVRTAMALLASR